MLCVSYSSEIKNLADQITNLETLIESNSVDKQTMLKIQAQTAEAFARTIERMATGQGSSNKRARLTSDDVEAERQEGIDRYVSGLLELRDAEHAKIVEAMKVEHSKEVGRLRSKAAEPINEFRISKQFHSREAELKKEVQQVRYALDMEKKRSKAVEWDVREKAYMKRDLAEMKQKCADRGVLLERIDALEAKLKKFEDRDLEGDPRLDSEEQLLERVKALMVGRSSRALAVLILMNFRSQDERDAVIASSVKEIDEKAKRCATAEKELKKMTAEADKMRACLEGEW
jgi:hypothetical protein